MMLLHTSKSSWKIAESKLTIYLSTVSTWIEPQSWREPNPLKNHAKSKFLCVFVLQSRVKNPERKIEPQGCKLDDKVSLNYVTKIDLKDQILSFNTKFQCDLFRRFWIDQQKLVTNKEKKVFYRMLHIQF